MHHQRPDMPTDTGGPRQPRRRSRGRTTTTLAAVLTLSLLGAACGGDDDEDAATDAPATTAGEASDGTDGTGAAGAADADTGEFCAAALAVEAAPSPPFSNEGPEAEAAALAGWAGETMQPLVAEVVATAPPELEGAVTTMSGAVDAIVGGDTSVFESPELAAAEAEAHAWELDNCGWATQEVTTVDYAFEGLPDEIPAGPTSFEMTNEGTELHEVILVRRNEGTTQPLEELLTLPEEEVGALVTEAGGTGPVAAGESVFTVADLTPGDYVVVCFVPTGMTAFDGPPPDGMPHAMAGMTAEFTVT